MRKRVVFVFVAGIWVGVAITLSAVGAAWWHLGLVAAISAVAPLYSVFAWIGDQEARS